AEGAPLVWPAVRRGVRWVTLPGARVALVGGEDDPAQPSREVTVAQHLGEGRFRLVTQTLLPAGLTAVSATAVPDGSVFVSGLERVVSPSDPDLERVVPAAFVIDPGTAQALRLDAPACVGCSNGVHNPRVVLRLADGVLMERGPRGTGLRLIELRTPFGNAPGALPQLDEASPGLAFDAAPHWSFDGASFRAQVEGARTDFATIRFADFSVQLDAVAAPAELLLVRDSAPPLRVAMDELEVAFGDCVVPRALGGVMEVRRSGAVVRIGSSGGVFAECPTEVHGRVGIAVRLSAGAALRRMSIVRL